MAEETWVVNASPLISLAKVGRLDLLHGPSRTLVVPEAVALAVHAGRTLGETWEP